MEKAPCYQCNDKYEACHGSCQIFLEYDKRYKAEQEKIKKAREEARIYSNYLRGKKDNKHKWAR